MVNKMGQFIYYKTGQFYLFTTGQEKALDNIEMGS
jgi:hypothetical protein